MTRKLRPFAATIALSAVAVFLIVKCKGPADKTPPEINPAFSSYISAFTSGVISSGSSIKIRLYSNDYKNVDTQTPIDKDLFDFDPEIDGEAYWLDYRTIKFQPKEKLPSGTVFDGEFYLAKIVEDVPDELETFKFQFQTIKQSFDVTLEGMKTYDKHDLRWQNIRGRLTTADVADLEAVKKLLTATQNGKQLHINWEKDPNFTVYRFQVDSVRRTEEAEQIEVKWNGKPLDVDEEGEEIFEIPALGDFKLMKTRVTQQPDQFITLSFSDPLLEDQNLDGLVKLSNNVRLRFVIEDNEIRAYPATRQAGAKTVRVDGAIKNILGYKMDETESIEVPFEDIKPEVRLVGNGVILPNSNGLLFPFETVNLKAVDVKIMRIFENNIGQFMQVNRLNGSREMQRVGRTIFKKSVKLTSEKPVDLGSWNTFSLDLAKMIKTEPGAIYRVEIGFRKKHSLYPCIDNTSTDSSDDELEETDDEDQPNNNYYYEEYYYDDYYDYNYYYYGDYNWKERDNPCHNTYYYQHGRKKGRNVLASNLGIIAKSGNSKELLFAVTDLKTTQPISGVSLEVYNYQNQLMSSVKSGNDGLAKIKLDKKPFLLIAKKGVQRGYLRLDNGSSISLSKFDVSGKQVQKGLKGYIYGERGVWRPGDSLFVCFVLEDKEMALPKNHPVTFQLKNSQGQLVKKIVNTKGVNGFYNFSTATNADAPTGNWSCQIKVGGASFSKTLRIEAIKPNRLKLNLDFGVELVVAGEEESEGELEVKWLHGAIAKNLKADVKATLKTIGTSFEKFKDFSFHDPYKKFHPEEVTVFDGKLDENGKAIVDPEFHINNKSPGMLKAWFTVRVFEKGGDFSIDRFSLPYSPYKTYVGIKPPKPHGYSYSLVTDTTHTVEVVTVDAHGTPIQREGLKVEIYKTKWRWWWNRYSSYRSNYNSSSYAKIIGNQTISTDKDGKGSFQFKVEYPEWGRFMIRVTDPQSGHSTASTLYADWPAWKGRANRANPDGATMLTFTADKKKYNVGEECTISFPSGGVGRALVSIESGKKVVDAYWVEAEKDQTDFSFKITEDMAPNVFLHITLVQPHSQTKNDLPIRLYGVTPILVENPNSHIKPIISMPDELAPEKDVTIRIKEEKGQPMTYTIAMVDDGLLDLTRFKTPDPWSHFYAKEALGVKTWDMYDMVMGAFTGEMAGLLAIGGDGEEKGEDGSKKANRFKPMVKFLGPFEISKGKTGTHTFTMPNYIGSVRTMVIAGQDGAYGATEKTVPVKKPLMVLATLPRVVGPGELVTLPVTVFAMEKKIKNVSVEVVANEFFIMKDGKKKTIHFNDVGDEVINFDMKIASKTGIGKVKVIVKSGSEKSTYEIEINVRNPNPEVTEYVDAVIEPGQTWNANYTLPGLAGTNKAILEVSNIPPIDLDRRIKYLIRYPHGCVEQTTSAAFPQLYLSNLMELDPVFEQKIDENIRGAIIHLSRFQIFDGGFSYWPGRSGASDWGTNYAGHFILEAKRKGYDIPIGMLNNFTKYQKNRARNWSRYRRSSRYYYRNQDLTQSYRLYTLALAGKPELGAMNRLKEDKYLSLSARWRLAAAYYLAGQPEAAKDLIYKQSMDVEKYRELSFTYGSRYRDRAMILETLSLLGERSAAKDIVDEISQRMSGGYWLSTQETAFSLIAMARFIGEENKVNSEMKFAYELSSGEKGDKHTLLPMSQVQIDVKNASSGTGKVTNNGDGVIFARIIMEGIPETGDQTASNNNLDMKVKYLDMSGRKIDPGVLEQGTDFIAEVTIHNPGIRGNLKEMALNQIFPSGWEIHNTRMDQTRSVHLKNTNYPTYQDIRDDRVYTYFNVYAGNSVTYRVLLNATYLGKFYLPATYCEAMYDNTINARRPGKWVKVVIPGEETAQN